MKDGPHNNDKIQCKFSNNSRYQLKLSADLKTALRQTVFSWWLWQATRWQSGRSLHCRHPGCKVQFSFSPAEGCGKILERSMQSAKYYDIKHCSEAPAATMSAGRSSMLCGERGLFTLRHVRCSVCFAPLSGGAGSRLLCCLDASSVTGCNKMLMNFYCLFV